MLDSHLAQLYGVSTKVFVQAVKRNEHRFPSDFMFQITKNEAEVLRSQIVTSKKGRGGRRYLPYAFTEHGAVMAANISNSPRAIIVSVYVVRAFVKFRETLTENKELATKLAKLERKLTGRLDIHEKAILQLFDEIRKLLEPSTQLEKPKRRIGFHKMGMQDMLIPHKKVDAVGFEAASPCRGKIG